MQLLRRLAASRIVRLLVVAGGSWRFWAASAFAAAATTIVAYVYTFASGDDAAAAGSYVYYDLVGGTAEAVTEKSNANATDRILLMNADSNPKCYVDCENLLAAGTTSKTKDERNWWEFLNSDKVMLSSTSYPYVNMFAGTHFKLHAKGEDGRVLWEMVNCRSGNLNKKAHEYINRLPYYKGTAKRVSARGSPIGNMTQAGTLIMLNTDEAQVLSSCYEEGIGTVYLDAVNAYKGYTAGRIAIEVAYGVFKTNVLGRVDSEHMNIPDDLEIASTNADGSVVYVRPEGEVCDEFSDDGFGTITTNSLGRVAWKRVNMAICSFTASGHEILGTNDVLNLTCTAGNSDKNFYRVWAAVQDPVMNPDLYEHCHRPMRLRIRRLDNPKTEPRYKGYSYDDLDGSGLSTDDRVKNGLLILDNIIASLPAMTASAQPKGEYVEGGSTRNEIGWRGSTTTLYPAFGDELYGAAALVAVTNAPPDSDVTDAWKAATKATMKYRWRYVGQTNDWQESAMVMTDGALASTEPLVLPNEPGDVEYRYETQLDAPYYGYVDYSGGDYGTPGYSERVKTVETRLAEEAIPGAGLPSGGTDFFFRLREGNSDQQEYRLQLRDEFDEYEIPFYLTGDGVWKAFVPVTTNSSTTVTTNGANVTVRCSVGTYDYRVVGMDPGRYYGGAETSEPLPWSGKAFTDDTANAGSNAWRCVTFDDLTGAIMFQISELSSGALTYTVVHADFQDFTGWTDAVSTNTYVGAYSEEKGRQSGSSPDTRTFPCELDDWTVTAASNQVYWTEAFEISKRFQPDDGWDDNAAYESFSESATPNGWRAYNGQWVCGKYRESAMGGDLALSLDRAGKGFLEYVNMQILPQGVDEFSVKGRVAQSADFDQFMYYSNTGVEEMTNYLFSSRVIMGTPNDTFDGNGTVSLVGYYRPGEGCYEIRAERIATDLVKLSLYKWTLDEESDQVTPQFIAEHRCIPAKDKNSQSGYQDGNGGMLYKSASGNNSQPTFLQCSGDPDTADQSGLKYGEMFIRCTTQANGTTLVEAGLLTDAGNSTGESDPSGAKHTYLKYIDQDNPFSYGYFGYTSLNCPARFFSAKWHKGETGAVFPTIRVDDSHKNKTRGTGITGLCETNPLCATAVAITYPTDTASAFLTISGKRRYRNWTNKPNRFIVYDEKLESNYQISDKNATLAVKPTGTIELYLDETTNGTSVTRLVGSHTFSNFVYETHAFTVRSTAQARPRLKTSAKSSADVVLDNALFTQWSAADYSDSDNYAFLTTKMRQNWGSPEHYVYLNGWVSTNMVGSTIEKRVTLAPARVRPNEVASIRAPLMDGRNDGALYGGKRGLGLGVFSYTYRDADSKCRVFVQYREQDGATGVSGATESADGWTTVATNDFSKMSAAERAGGTISTYFGLHGTKGMMRIIVDPDVVTAAQDAKKNKDRDPSYGAITITSFVSRDAPPLDDRCWMGWNMRTTDAEDERSLYDGRGADAGLALGLNNSATRDIETEHGGVYYGDLYVQKLPFVQTPTFRTNAVGEVGFRARRLPGATNNTEVAIFGAKTSASTDETAWSLLNVYVVSNDTYLAYTYRGNEGDDYAAFRLAVIGVGDVADDVKNYSDKMKVRPAQRVLIDDVYVSEAVHGKVAFRNVAAFRKGLDDAKTIENILSSEQQPLVDDSWGVQCEVYIAQMEEEIDRDRTPEVYLHWYVGEEPWGFANWRKSEDAHVAKLAQVDDTTNWVFRSSFLTCPDAVVDPISTNCTVQYTLEMRYWAAGSDETTVPQTNWLSSAEWTNPSWYHPLDLNAGKSFSAYTILDGIAPGWAWINEVNVFGSYNRLWVNSDKERQYVEVAMPADADLTGWRLKFLGVDSLAAGVVTTNTVANFGNDLGPGTIPGTKETNIGSNCVFLVVAGWPALSAGTLDASQGEVDGYWKFERTCNAFQQNNTIRENRVFAIQLVRPSGIIEHEVVAVGTNRYANAAYSENSPERYVEFFNSLEKGGKFFYIGDEKGGDACSNGSIASEVTSTVDDWSSAMVRTPGRVNAGQYINPEHPMPSGDSVHVYFNISDNMWQTIVDQTGKTNVSRMVVVRKDDPDGLDVIYDIDRWYVLDGVAVDDVAVTPVKVTDHQYKLNVAKNCSDSVVRVDAAARENAEILSQYGVTADNAYHDAIMSWLSGGKDIYGNAWEDNGEDVKLAEYQDLYSSFVTNMTLTSMYWLDIPPTEGGWILRGGIGTPSEIVDAVNAKTNVRVSVFMMISNKNEEASWEATEPHRLAHAPYVLRGLGVGENSLGLDPAQSGVAWTSVTFKVTSFMLNNVNDFGDRESHIPLRWFVFNENSFNPRGSVDADGDSNAFWSTIDVRHPYTPASPAYYSAGYRDWILNHGVDRPTLLYRWDLDDRLTPIGVEPLKADSTFK